MTPAVKELSCPSFSTGEKKGSDSLEEILVIGTQMPSLNPQLATDRDQPELQTLVCAEQPDRDPSKFLLFFSDVVVRSC